jgi:hypothetical protein
VVVRSTDGAAFYAPSVWRDASGAVVAAPPALVYATASGGAVVSPAGDFEDTGRVIKTAPARRHRPTGDQSARGAQE